jgi:putative transposase
VDPTRARARWRARRAELAEQVRGVFDEHRGVYGSPRVHAELSARGVDACENTVARVMREQQIRAKTKRRFRVHTTDANHAHPVAGNVLDRRFCRPRPDQAWAADVTYIATGEGWLYLAVVIDLCSRRVVGFATGATLRAVLCVAALSVALSRRRPPRGLLHHSDRGVQYACAEYQRLLAARGIRCSMSGAGNCYDNAVAESFFGTLKTELAYHERYRTRAEASASLSNYIEDYYNRRRRHSSLGYLSPEAFEAAIN